MPDEFHILLVEDSRTDVKIIERALREGKVEHRLTASSIAWSSGGRRSGSAS